MYLQHSAGKIKLIYYYLSLERCVGDAYINLHTVGPGVHYVTLNIVIYVYIILIYIYIIIKIVVFLFDSARSLLDSCVFIQQN